MDYRVVDKNTDSDGCEKMMSASPLYIEPCFLSYTPPFKDKPNGTITTFEALWMGVHVECNQGERYTPRVSSSVIKALGVSELVAADQQQYVNITCDFANKLEGLAVLRDELRPRMSQSSFLDGRWFSRKFESALLGVTRECSDVK